MGILEENLNKREEKRGLHKILRLGIWAIKPLSRSQEAGEFSPKYHGMKFQSRNGTLCNICSIGFLFWNRRLKIPGLDPPVKEFQDFFDARRFSAEHS